MEKGSKKMALTLNDVCNKLKHLPETDLLEVLEINSSDIVDRFEDVILERMDYLLEDLE